MKEAQEVGSFLDHSREELGSRWRLAKAGLRSRE